MKRTIFVSVLFFSVLYSTRASFVQAAKKFIPKRSTAVVRRSTGPGVSIPAVAKYRGDKLGILLSFSNFNGIDSADYSFTYNGNGIDQGAGGTIRSSNNPTVERELLFGTCSSGVCTYHYNLKNARLVLTIHYTNGRTASKSYRIKTYQ